jgi:hypothetical protein
MQDITALAESIVINTPLGYRDDAYYQSIETKLLELLIQFVCDADATGAVDSAFLAEFIRPVMAPGASPPPLRSLPMVAYLAALPYPELFGFITRTQTDAGQPAYWARRMAQVMGMSKDHETGILLGLSRRVRVFTLPEVAGVSARSDFSLDLVGRQPSTLLIGMPRHSGQAMETYSALIVTQLLQQLKRLAFSSGGRLPVPVTIYLDEIATQGRIPGLERDLATMRDLGAAFVLGLQNTSALARRYGREGMADMLSNTNTKIVLGKNLGAEDAEAFARLSGNTTILTPSVTTGARGDSRGFHAARRELITADQIRSMRQFEALVFLQTGHVAHTMLRPFHQLDLHRLPSIPHFARGGTTREGIAVPPSILLLYRHRELDRDLGPWDVRPPKKAAAPAPAPAAQGEPDPEVERLVTEATAYTSSMQTDVPATEPPPGAGVRKDDRSTEKPSSEGGETASAGKLAAAAALEAKQTSGTPGHDHAMDEVRGFLRAALMRQDLPVPDCAGAVPTAWRVRTTKNDVSMAVRQALVEAYAARRGTRTEKMLHHWREAGLVEPSPLQIADGPGRGPLPAVVLTAKALGRDRLTPALLDKVAALPELSPRRIPALKNGRAVPARGKPGSPPQSVSRSGDPQRALRAVARWAEEHREALVIPAGESIGRWEAMANGIPALLIRSHELMRLLSAEHAETREVLRQWKHTGVIVTADNAQDTHDNRFTVFMRPGEGMKSGTRYIAIRWEHLERAGLSRRSPARPMMIPERSNVALPPRRP